MPITSKMCRYRQKAVTLILNCLQPVAGKGCQFEAVDNAVLIVVGIGIIFEKPFTKPFSDCCNAAKISVFCGTIKVSLRSFILVCIAYPMARIVSLNLWSRLKWQKNV
jgi:hypothetical protein